MDLGPPEHDAAGMTSAPPPAAPSVDPSWEPPTPPPPGPPARSQLRRSSTDKMIGGVSGGLAEYSGVDPLLWRVGFVALALAGPGVPVYLLLWLFMPSDTRAPRIPGERTPKPPPAPRSPVPGVTLAGLLIVMGVLVLVDRFTGWDVTATGFFGAALLVVGLGLVAAAFTGGRRARGGLIFLGVVLSLATIASATGPWRYGTGVGDRTYRPVSVGQVRPLYELGAGDLTVDLSDVDVADLSGPIRTRIDHGLGDLTVLVPASADVRISVDQGLGDLDVFHQGATDGYFAGTGSAAWTDDGDPEFVLTIDSGAGDVEVSRA
jgi:phage shock protein PspC (stress-responsive transcriptional regulator)